MTIIKLNDMKNLFLILLALCSMSAVMAQSISGRVVNENNEPMPYVSVVLQAAVDSSYVGGVATNENGEFTLNAENGVEYQLQVSYIGYESVTMNCHAGSVGTIVMKVDDTMIDEVSIVASRTVYDASGYTVNLRSSEIAKGKQTSDALAFLPGVTLKDGDYEINGLPVSEIYIDGVKLASSDELKTIPADMIDRVKIDYLAGSNQNAAMTGGIIHISLRQPPQGGYYGAVVGGSSYHFTKGFEDAYLNGVIYYRYKNLSVYDNLSMGYYQPKESAEQTTWNMANGDLSIIAQESDGESYNIVNRLSLTQQINDRHSIGGSYYIATNKIWSSNMSLNSADVLLSQINNYNNYLLQEGTLKYNATLGKRGTTMEVIGDYFNRQADNHTDYLPISEGVSTEAEDETSLNMYKLSIDFTDPISQKAVLKYGASVQYITQDYAPTHAQTEVEERFQTSLIPTRTTGLTPLAYVSAMGQVWKIRYNIGVNCQINNIGYETLDDGAKAKNIQWGINPMLQMMMPLDNEGKHALMVNYKRTLDDIPYAAISSTVRWSDPYNYTVGNPDLKSPVGDMVMVSASLFRNMLNITGMYAHESNSIHWETIQSATDPEVFYTMPVNLASNNFYGLGVEFNWQPVKPWTMKLSSRFTLLNENATMGGVHYDNLRFRQYYTMNNTFSFNHGWGGMLNMMFEPKFKSFDRTYHAVYAVNGQIYKNLCKDKLQITLSFTALGNRRKMDRYVDDIMITDRYTQPVQNIGLQIVWRFSGGKSVNVHAVESGSQSFNEIRDNR